MSDVRFSPAAMRMARPVADIAESLRFYVEILGLRHLGGFDDHEGYSGAFVGVEGADWHLEFTSQAGGSAVGTPTDEDLLVLYLSTEQFHAAGARLKDAGVQTLPHENPYWAQASALVFRDPDGYLLVLCPLES
ncbi:MAG TPA: VOC family protein [Acidimicrobiales bacterium]|jgi:catechol 2,3-dioxygenase-like lactoylglutathione lyase family enzyme|nr:VOC family protein [Acidimicrobiales bacterium]